LNWSAVFARPIPAWLFLFFGGPEEQADHERIQAMAGGKDLFFPKTQISGRRRPC
jgi:hypothetical protein